MSETYSPLAAFEHYDYFGEGGTTGPSQCTLRKARENNLYQRKKQRKSDMIFLPNSTIDAIFASDDGERYWDKIDEDENDEYHALLEVVLDHFGIRLDLSSLNYEQFNALNRAAEYKIRPIPDEHEAYIRGAGLKFINFMSEQGAPEALVKAVENYISDPAGYRREQKTKLEDRRRAKRELIKQMSDLK